MNAIILAAGKSNRFAPFTYEKPKGLFRVKGERLIEQLHAAGVQEIYVVVGYMKEKMCRKTECAQKYDHTSNTRKNQSGYAFRRLGGVLV
jgi:CTP:phosphocholine cytidylyltransferase-like protein